MGIYILLYLAALQNVGRNCTSRRPPTGRQAAELLERHGAGADRDGPGAAPGNGDRSHLFTEPYLLTGGGGPNGPPVTGVDHVQEASSRASRASRAIGTTR